MYYSYSFELSVDTLDKAVKEGTEIARRYYGSDRFTIDAIDAKTDPDTLNIKVRVETSLDVLL